jgi:hypothetical protein
VGIAHANAVIEAWSIISIWIVRIPSVVLLLLQCLTDEAKKIIPGALVGCGSE